MTAMCADARVQAAQERLATVPERRELRGLTRQQLATVCLDVRLAADLLASYSRHLALCSSVTHCQADGSALLSKEDVPVVVGALRSAAESWTARGEIADAVRARSVGVCLRDDQ